VRSGSGWSRGPPAEPDDQLCGRWRGCRCGSYRGGAALCRRPARGGGGRAMGIARGTVAATCTGPGSGWRGLSVAAPDAAEPPVRPDEGQDHGRCWTTSGCGLARVAPLRPARPLVRFAPQWSLRRAATPAPRRRRRGVTVAHCRAGRGWARPGGGGPIGSALPFSPVHRERVQGRLRGSRTSFAAGTCRPPCGTCCRPTRWVVRSGRRGGVGSGRTARAGAAAVLSTSPLTTATAQRSLAVWARGGAVRDPRVAQRVRGRAVS